MKLKEWIKAICPPIVWSLLRKIFGGQKIIFSGDFSSWQNALNASSGYDAPMILEQVHESALKVKQGLAAYERDSVTFSDPDTRWPILASLLYVLSQQKRLGILDFGGALGSLYFQHKSWFNNIDHFYWAVIEQEHFVASGKKQFEDKHLKFFNNINICIEKKGLPDVVIFSGVLQYLEFPFEILNEVASKKIPYIIIDRTALINEKKDRLTVQNVPREIYEASYPAWFFAEILFIQQIEAMGYGLISEFLCDDHLNQWSYFKGFIFKRDGA